MARLSAADRAKLPDSAFAYVDSRGDRRLPINDAAHVRAALARFDQVRFEDDRARERARKRLLRAAKRHGIVPVGFITGQLQTARQEAAAGRIVIELGRIGTSRQLEDELRGALDDPLLSILRWSKEAGSYVGWDDELVPLPGAAASQTVTFLQGRGHPLTAIVHDRAVLVDPEITEVVLAAVHLVMGKELVDAELDRRSARGPRLPEGVVSFLLTDIEESTALLNRLGDRYADVLTEVRRVIREAVLRAGGREVEARADEFVAVFEAAPAALEAAVEMQRALGRSAWPDGVDVRVRVGISTGDIALTESGYVGISVHTAARVMAAAHGGQILVSGDTWSALAGAPPDGIRLDSLGRHRLRGLAGAQELYQLVGEGLLTGFPPPRTTA
jgi:class 3 adenylate cyclase